MQRTINRLRQARRDIENAYLFIGRDNFNAAEHFLDTLDNLFDKLATTPAMGHKRALPRAGEIYIFPVSTPWTAGVCTNVSCVFTIPVL